jgi:hypothetical protein
MSRISESVGRFSGDHHWPVLGDPRGLFQLLMVASFVVSAAFVIRWLVRDPWQTLRILAMQIVAALAALAPVFYFKL